MTALWTEKNLHALAIPDLEKELKTSVSSGLTVEGVAESRRAYGDNTPPKPKKKLSKLERQFASMLPSLTPVVRDGAEQEVSTNELVVGDVVRLRTGDKVPADIIVVEADGLAIDNSSLTGEAAPVPMKPGASSEDAMGAPNVAFHGTICVEGAGKGIVVAVVRSSFIMSIASVASGPSQAAAPGGVKESIKLAYKMKKMLQHGMLVKNLEAVHTMMSINTIVVTPEDMSSGRPSCVAWSAGNSSGDLNNLPVSTSSEAEKALIRALCAGSCNDAVVLGEFAAKCMASEQEQKNGGQLVNEFRQANPVVFSGFCPESSNTRVEIVAEPKDGDDVAPVKGGCFGGRQRTIDGPLVYVYGDASVVMARCSAQMGKSGEENLDKKACAENAKAMEAKGYTVVAIAAGYLNKITHGQQFQQAFGYTAGANLDDCNFPTNNLFFLGLVGLDEDRSSTKDGMALAKAAGIQVVVASPRPANAVLAMCKSLDAEIGTVHKKDDLKSAAVSEALSGKDNVALAEMQGAQKLGLVQELMAKGKVVAFIGSCVNEAPALKCANLGISLGISGSDVAKEASDVIQVDDSLKSILEAHNFALHGKKTSSCIVM